MVVQDMRKALKPFTGDRVIGTEVLVDDGTRHHEVSGFTLKDGQLIIHAGAPVPMQLDLWPEKGEADGP